MTFLAVSISVEHAGDVAAALARARKAVGTGARLVEWRIDGLADSTDGISAATALVADSPAPSIATCRGRSEGGAFVGPEERRAALLEALVLADRPPRYVDVEFSAYAASSALRDRVNDALEHRRGRDVHSSLILSVHDFHRRPPDLLQRVEQMAAVRACDVIKVAWQARSVRDNLQALELLSERRTPMIALCMGRFSLLSRVLAPKFGGLLVYAADRPGAGTAPGQPTVRELRERFAFDRIGQRTAVYGVIGWPVEHSRGPAIYNGGFDAIGYDGVYLPLPVPAEYEHFKASTGALLDHQGLDFRGASVTIPHKENLVRFVGERGGRVDDLARRAGAANTLTIADDSMIACSNTDAPAALDALCHGMGLARDELAGKRVAVVGAGGIARAVVAALSHAGASVIIFNRTRWRAEALAEAFHGRATAAGGPAHVVVGKPQAIACGCFDIFVNCTPVGMEGGPAPDESPLPPDVPLDESVTVFETVYTPKRTPLVERAEAAGARIIPGADLFVRQAALQFQGWTGTSPQLDAFTGALARLDS